MKEWMSDVESSVAKNISRTDSNEKIADGTCFLFTFRQFILNKRICIFGM
jgi:hypothetical protein